MIFRALAAAILVFGLTGCQNLPPAYPLPSQFVPFDTFRAYRISRMVSMADKGADAHFVSDILSPLNGWSWTKKRPTVKVKTWGTQDAIFVMDFVLTDVTFKATGPVTVTFFVNDHVLGSQVYTEPGTLHWEKAVPADWLQPNAETLIGCEIDKVFMSPTDRIPYGLILTKIGLMESQPGQ